MQAQNPIQSPIAAWRNCLIKFRLGRVGRVGTLFLLLSSCFVRKEKKQFAQESRHRRPTRPAPFRKSGPADPAGGLVVAVPPH